ncbi:unnamed protein product [Bursaphelenchus okinawaensis]|uniref:Uncharacterized protein n=1 Tax=Bursaphelenchus okinawaensis TaxID=465554 RepID=A0A811KQ86_9BILA|nr:unnamed protein product [Bursaphelenchus okinawaensis]CAG9111183.1 unnamed protein product [Bursaphelenchus okinawaensis]
MISPNSKKHNHFSLNQPVLYCGVIVFIKLCFSFYAFFVIFYEDPIVLQIYDSLKGQNLYNLLELKIPREDFGANKSVRIRQQKLGGIIYPKNFTTMFDEFYDVMKDDMGR